MKQLEDGAAIHEERHTQALGSLRMLEAQDDRGHEDDAELVTINYNQSSLMPPRTEHRQDKSGRSHEQPALAQRSRYATIDPAC